MEGNISLLVLIIWPMLGAFLGYLLGRGNDKKKRIRDYFADFVTGTEFFLLLFLLVRVAHGEVLQFQWKDFCDLGISFQLDGFRVLYGSIAAFMWMMTTIFSKQYFAHYRNRNRYYLFTLLTLGATMGVFLSADLFTTFLFFEVMSFTSYVWVAQDERKESLRAAETYLFIAILGGLAMLMGIFLLYDTLGTLEMDLLLKKSKEIFALHQAGAVTSIRSLYIAGALLLFGFGVKAGMYPLHIWLPKAHPVAPAPASALLSGILTKTGVFGILMVSCNLFLYDANWGKVILVFGTLTMLIGAILAVCSIDLKHILACSSMSQIGFILIGVGMQGLLGAENALAVRGTLLHMVNHSLLKLVLFMAAGVVFMNAHTLDLNELRGFGRNKPLLKFVFLMGALGIGGIPLWNGYVSKTLIHESIMEYVEILEKSGASCGLFQGLEGLFLVAGGLTIAYMTKIYVALFIEKHPDKQKKMESKEGSYMNKQSTFALLGGAVILPLFGVLPNVTLNAMADLGEGFMHGGALEHPISYFSLENIKGAAISIAIGIFVYVVLIRLLFCKRDERGNVFYQNPWPVWLDLENLIYRPLITRFFPFFFAIISRALEQMVDALIFLLRKTIYQDVKPKRVYIGTRFTYFVGYLLDDIALILNKTILKRKPMKRNFLVVVSNKKHTLDCAAHVIGRSLAFGLLLFCVGLCLTLLYLLLR